ncbi:sensor domain-containing protein [Mycobacterium sp.]|uniref:sensor domain-containing protein n=1 Tax=Mycobacterium sp. TaxID=1785 RepID=UPI0025ECAAE1|nr:sensor domain-containing protein [Mycobacterium sp.]
MLLERRRRFLAVTSAAAIVLGLAACGTHTTAGVPVQAKKVTGEHSPDAAPESPAPPPKPLSANSIKNLQLSTEDVVELAGLPLDKRTEFASPGMASSDYDKPDCALVMGITKDALGEGEFTAYRGARSEGIKGDSLIGSFTQHVATFETAAKASELFHNAYKSLGKCNGTTISHKSKPTVWKLMAAGSFDGDVVTFGELQQTDQQQNYGWRCDHQARVKNNVIIEAFLCAWANGSPAAAAAVDQISARIPPPDKPAPKAPSDFLGPDKIKSVIVGVPQVSKILGANLGETGTFYYPPDPLDYGDKSHCSPLVGLDTSSFGANVDYTAFRETDSRESKDSFQHIVDQKVATYVGAGAASAAFQNALKGLVGCDGARVPTPQPDKQWQLPNPSINGNSAQWAVIELNKGQPDTWRCAVDFRAQSNVLLAAKVCQYGNPADVARQVADEIAGSIPK